MNILLTGHLGFIGRHLHPYLREDGHKVVGVDKKATMDLADATIVAKIPKIFPDCDLVIHLAAQTSTKQSIENPREDFFDNAVGTFHVLELARFYGARFLYMTSRKELPGDDGARSPYGLSKYIGTQLCEEWSRTYGLQTLVLRTGNVYGPGQDSSGDKFFFDHFVKASITGTPITIYGDGKQSRDMLWIGDCVELLRKAVAWLAVDHEATPFHTLVEAGGGAENEVSILELLDFLGYKNYNFGLPLTGDKKRLVADNETVKRILGWEGPTIHWKEGATRMLNYYRENPPVEGTVQSTR